MTSRGAAVAIGIQTPGGFSFDAIVFGEQEPRRWMAGSEFFRRSVSARGESEDTAGARPVAVAITYAEDGAIRLFRDGKPYGEPYKSSGPFAFEAGKAEVVFGLRHAPAGGNRMLAGTVIRARLYDRALDPAEVAASAPPDNHVTPGENSSAALPMAAARSERSSSPGSRRCGRPYRRRDEKPSW